MNIDKKGGDRQEAVERFIQAFDGDRKAAIETLIDYVKTVPAVVRKPKAQRPTGSVLLSVKNLTKTYKLGKQHLTVVKDVSFDIYEGEIVAITGASGSGKSTLLHLMGGLDKPTSGDIFIDSTNLARLSDRKLSMFRRQTVGYVFQFFYLQPFLRLKQNLEVPGMFARAKRKDRSRHVTELAEKVGLQDRLQHFPKELSGGQMQRAAIARALLNQPRIILADEPTGNLDSKNGEQIIRLFESIRDELGTTVVIITHDEAIANRADRTIRLADGRLA